MREVYLKEIYQMACDARDSIWEQAKSVGREPKIYLHWTAGHYHQLYLNDYHISIDEDGTIYAEHDLDEVLSHTYRRNTGAVGITLACCAFANTESLGDEPPTQEQIEAMAQVIVAIADGLWITIDREHVMTHGEAGDNLDNIYPHEAYGCATTCERWDLQYLETEESPSFTTDYDNPATGGNVLRGKANWYKNEGALNFQ